MWRINDWWFISIIFLCMWVDHSLPMLIAVPTAFLLGKKGDPPIKTSLRYLPPKEGCAGSNRLGLHHKPSCVLCSSIDCRPF